jgi:hypothetical protein
MIQFKPWKTFINNHLKNLFQQNSIYLDFLPLWNFYNHCGSPLIANLQSQVFYPFSIVFYVIKDFVVAYKIFLILHFFLSAFFMYILLKKKLSFVSSLCGSIIWTFNGYMISRTEFMSVFSTVIWLPLIIYLFSYISDKFELKKIIFVSLVITIQFLAGHAQMWFYSMIYLLLYSIYQSYKYKSYCPIISCLLSIFLAIFISAVQFLPTIEFFYYSTRFGKGIKNIAEFGMNYKDAILGSLNLRDIINFVYPFNWQFDIKNFCSTKILTFTNYWWYTFYIGLVSVCLSIIGFIYIKQVKEKIFYLLIISFILFYSLGENFIVFKLLYKFIPFIRIFRYPSTSVFLIIFVLSFFASYGTEFVISLAKKYKIYRYLFIFIPLICFVELYIYSTKISILLPKSIMDEKTETIEFLIEKSFQDKYPYRFALTPITQNLARAVRGKSLYTAIRNYRDRLFGNVNLDYLLYNFRGQDIELKNYYKFLDFVYSCPSLDSAIPFFSISNVKYIISAIPQNTKLLKLIKDDELKIYENPFVLPPVFFVKQKIEETDLYSSLKLMKELKFNIFNTIILHCNKVQNLISNNSFHNTNTTIEEFCYYNNKVYIKTNCSQEGFLVVSQNFYPSWQCLVNNRKTKIYRCNIFMNCIYLQKGYNEIWFYYDPISFKIGCVITLLCLFFIIVYLYEKEVIQ